MVAPDNNFRGKRVVPFVWNEANSNFRAWDGINRDYFIELAKGNIPGESTVFILGTLPSTAVVDVFETIWDQGGLYTYLTADTQLFASSSSALDTTQTIIISGLDDTFTEVTRTVTLNGQTQVALDGLMFRVFQALTNLSLNGDVYIAESDTLTGGVPDTTSKIKAKIPQLSGVTRQFTYTVPAGKSLLIKEQVLITGKNQDAEALFLVRPFGFDFLRTSDASFYQSSNNIGIDKN